MNFLAICARLTESIEIQPNFTRFSRQVDFSFSRFEMSSPESSLLPRDADFGYEVIEGERNGAHLPTVSAEDNEAEDEESSVSVASHYRGTPPLKGKKRRTSSHQQRKESESRPLVSALVIRKVFVCLFSTCWLSLRITIRR